MERELDRVVGRQRGVGQRRRVARIEIPERHEQPRVGDEHVLGHAAVAAEAAAGRAELRRALAQGLQPGPARAAAPAAPRPVDRDGLADLPALHARAERLDPAGVLVPERERQLVGQKARGPLHHVQVGVARTRPADLHEHLARPRLRHRHVPQDGRLLPLDELEGLHQPRPARPGQKSSEAATSERCVGRATRCSGGTSRPPSGKTELADGGHDEAADVRGRVHGGQPTPELKSFQIIRSTSFAAEVGRTEANLLTRALWLL